MTKFTFDKNDWDEARPASVKETGVGAAITAFLKSVPGGNTDSLKSPEACIKAAELLGELGAVLDKAFANVSKAKDDTKGTAKLLKAWCIEAERGIDAIKERHVELVEWMVVPATKKLSDILSEIEAELTKTCDAVKKADTNMGAAEKLIGEAFIALVARASDLREHGEQGETPDDFMKDPEFKTIYALWLDQVDITERATRILEFSVERTQMTRAKYKELVRLLKETHAELKSNIDLDCPAIKAFKQVNSDIEKYERDCEAKYHRALLMPDFTPSKEVRRELEGQLRRRFNVVGKIDADKYYESMMDQHGFNDRVLKTRTKQTQVMIGDILKLSKDIEDVIDQGGDPSEDIAKMTKLRDALDAVNQSYLRGRANQELAQALDKAPADIRKSVETAMAWFARVAEQADTILKRTLKVAKSGGIGGHRIQKAA